MIQLHPDYWMFEVPGGEVIPCSAELITVNLLGEAAAPPRRISESDLRQLACESGKGFELAFFPRLREELRQQLNQSPHVVRFKGLRSCVKQLAGARRWTDRCQCLSDQIVDYLRHCLSNDPDAKSCSLMVL